jgi:predicted transcriptional regulator
MAEIQRRLLEHQRRQKLGDRVAPMSELARRADVHHSTLYQALHGERVDNRTQIVSIRPRPQAVVGQAAAAC